MQTIEEIFNKITCNGNREMTIERFKEAINEINEQKICPSCGSNDVYIIEIRTVANRCEDCGVEWKDN